MTKVRRSTIARARKEEEELLGRIGGGMSTRDNSNVVPINPATEAVQGFRTEDSFQNFALQLGMGTDNALSASGYGFNPITRIRTLLEWIHRGSWLGGMAVDLVADDMTRGGIEINSVMDPEESERVLKAFENLFIWPALNESQKWSRLYGGALGVFLIDGHDPKTPLRMDAVGKGQFKGIIALDRWMVEPNLQDLVTEFGPNLGNPKYYRINTDAPVYSKKTLHYSRCFRLEGIRLPYWQRIMENMWGVSVLERMYDRMVAFDSATQGAAQLVHKMYTRIYKVDKLRELVAGNQVALAGLTAYVDFMRRFQSNEGITLIDARDDFVPHQQTVSTGISEVLVQFGQQISGSLQIPLIRLFGQSPAGLNSTGESDLRTYYDGILQKQEREFREPCTKTIELISRSEQIKLPKGWGFNFKPLWQLTDEQKATVAKTDVDTVLAAEGSGTIDHPTALKELRQLSRTTGRFTNITDEHIKAAEAEPPPAMEGGDGGGDDGGPTKPPKPGAPPKPGTPDKKDTPKPKREGAPAPKAGEPKDKPEPKRAGAPKPKAKDALPSSEMFGLPIVIECKSGDHRFQTGPLGMKPWPSDYGYIRRTESGEGPDEGVDVFVGPDRSAPFAWIMNHSDERGRFEEHKIMLGFNSRMEAHDAYFDAYGRQPMGPAVELPVIRVPLWLQAVDPYMPVSTRDNAWTSSEHPRKPDGKFGSGGSGMSESGPDGKQKSTHPAAWFSASDLGYLKTEINDPSSVDKYREMIRRGEPIKPIQLVKVPGQTQLSLQDGNHRLTALRAENVPSIPVQVMELGTDFKLTDITSKSPKPRDAKPKPPANKKKPLISREDWEEFLTQ